MFHTQIVVIEGNTDTVLNIDNVNNPSHSPYERLSDGPYPRSADQGIVIPSYHPFSSEAIVLEDGHSKIIVEEEIKGQPVEMGCGIMFLLYTNSG